MQQQRHLQDWIDGYMDYTHNTEPPDSFRRWVAISVIAGVLRRKCYLQWGDITFFPNLYIVLCSPPGKARKGTAMEPGLRFLQEPSLSTRLAAESITREALIRELEGARDHFQNPETGQHIIHSSLTIYSHELTSFIGFRNLTLISDLTDWFDCRAKWTYRTKGQGTNVIDGVFVNLIGATTPSQIHSALPPEAIGGGLTSRMIFIYESDKGKSIAIPKHTIKEEHIRENLFKDLEIMSLMGGGFQVTDDFLNDYELWYHDQNPPFRDERFAGYVERRPTFILKLSMILCASRGEDMLIGKEDLHRAIEFLTEAESNMPTALSGVGENKQSGLTTRIMIEIKNTEVTTFPKILAHHMHDATKFEIEKILDSLQSIKFISYVENTGEIRYNPNFEQDYQRTPRKRK